jgi:hypothetical protein
MIGQERTKEIFLALKLHFSSNYDFIRYHGKMKRATMKPNEIFHINKIRHKFVEEDKVIEFFLFNIIHDYWTTGGFPGFIGNYANKEATENYESWKSWFASYCDNLEHDLIKLESFTLREIIDPTAGHPILFRRTSGGSIHFNTVALIANSIPLIPYWKENCQDPVFEQFIMVLEKYRPFITSDRRISRQIIEKILKRG